MDLAPVRQDFDTIVFQCGKFSDNHNDPVYHGFFGRNGGFSHGIYGSLNCGRGSDDESELVMKNLETVGKVVGVPAGRILTLHQVHGDTCLVARISEIDAARPKADAHVTDIPGLALGILTADCAPVLFRGTKADGSPVIGAAHAGWKGALGGILDSTLAEMKALGATPSSIRACIGPCIGPASYEVSEAFAEPFLAESLENERFFKCARREGHLMFDLAGYCAARMAGLGVEQVFIKDLDTFYNEEDFFSYRRATHRKEDNYGRQISVVVIK
jgi:YfiH family protein